MSARSRAVRIVASPVTYFRWAALTIAALLAAYPPDPYVFGFTALGLAWATGFVTLLAIGGLFLAEGWRQRLAIGAFVGLAIGAVAKALAILATFKWA